MAKENKSKTKSQSKKTIIERIVDEVKGENDYVALKIFIEAGNNQVFIIREEHLQIQENHIIENKEEYKRLFPINKIVRYDMLTNKVL